MDLKLTIASVRSALQRGLLGSITPNVRLVNATFTEDSIDIYFYYDHPPSEDEEELTEVVSTEVLCSFADISTNVHRFVIPYPERLPQDHDKLYVYARWEKTPDSELR